MISTHQQADIVMVGTFSAWRAGTIQSRALPFARILHDSGYRVIIITTPWDEPSSAGQIDIVDDIPIINTTATEPYKSPFAVREQLKIVAQFRPRAIHVIKPRGFGGLAAQSLLLRRDRPRIVVDADDWEGDGGWSDTGGYSMPMQRIFNWQETSLLKQADQVVAASSLVAARSRRVRGNDHSVSLIRNGIDSAWRTQLWEASSKMELPRPNRVLIYSRFQEFGAGWIEAFASALGLLVGGPTEVVLIGAKDRTSGSQQVSKNVKITNLGWVDRTELPAILASGSVAVFPLDDSLISRSKQSAKLIELMAAGCPVVASDIGEVRATLGDAGVAIRDRSPETFAIKVAELLSNSEMRSSLSSRATSRSKQFDIATVARDLPRIYANLGVEPA